MKILDTDIQAYINANLHVDLHSLLLKKSPFPDVPMSQIVQQIKGKKIAQKKFSFLLKEGIIFPPHLNLEQASSQVTAEYKAQLLQGQSFVDLTSGFGIDAYFLSQRFSSVTLVERNHELLGIVKHNWDILNRKANFIHNELEDFLKENTQTYDVVYLDPARRGNDDRKKFLLEDLSPNILEIQSQLHQCGQLIMVKLSPLIDVSYLLSVLQDISEVHIIAVRNEVKELLVIIRPRLKVDGISITAINLASGEPAFNFQYGEEQIAIAEYSSPLKYLYIPNNAILKSGAFNLIAKRFKLKKLHPNTHFYTSEMLVNEFPGRVLEVAAIDAKELRKGERYNIISRNHPLTPEQIKRKYKITDGGNAYLIFTQTIDGKKIILKSTGY
ncbi:methyltransferase [Chryseobacterium sp. 6424]|uniref:class I SAM-dependent methyltransferase n=1 Tax=Chryseobacterium sp. 6424 TaxID=2039166 RepID=UPI000EFAC97D|nr:class I SAM-dependent methyltransferase [Chryseobacterium sp. 6424]AYO57881.1 methyltransferase [Chryseobacterium sp. 6424]